MWKWGFFSNILDNIHIQILYYVDTDITMSINGKEVTISRNQQLTELKKIDWSDQEQFIPHISTYSQNEEKLSLCNENHNMAITDGVEGITFFNKGVTSTSTFEKINFQRSKNAIMHYVY